MATSAKANESSLKCAICLDLYTDPRVLPCLHTYCLKCIKDLPVTDNTLTCPQCRAKHEIAATTDNKGGVTTYPLDTSILPQLEEAKVKLGVEQPKSCGFCPTPTPAVGYCVDCEEYLCKGCRDGMHKKAKLFTGHRIGKKSYFSASKQSSYCLHHPEYKLEVFCNNCVTLMCCKCMMMPAHHYQQHQTQLIKNDSENENTSEIITGHLITSTQEVISKEDKFKVYLNLVEKIEKVALAHQDELRTKLKNVFDLLMEMLEAKFTEDNKKIWSAKNDLETLLSQIDSSRSFSSHAQSLVSKGESLLLVNQVLQCLVKINNTDMTKPIEDVWNIDSTTADFHDQVNAILDLDKLSFICSDEESKMYKTDESLEGNEYKKESIDPSVQTVQHYIGNEIIEGGTKRKTTSIIFRPNTNEIFIDLQQPFATFIVWQCKEIADPMYGCYDAFNLKTSLLGDRQIHVSLSRKNYNRYGYSQTINSLTLQLISESVPGASITFKVQFPGGFSV